MSRRYETRNRRSRKTRRAEMAILQAIAAQELAAVLDNNIAALDQPGLDHVVDLAFANANGKEGRK